MAAKTANVLARVEPDVKEKAEEILSQLGIPVSTVINMLYRQIVLTRSVPFPLTLPSMPVVRSEMDSAAFDEVMRIGMEDVKAGRSRPVDEVFAELRQEIR